MLSIQGIAHSNISDITRRWTRASTWSQAHQPDVFFLIRCGYFAYFLERFDSPRNKRNVSHLWSVLHPTSAMYQVLHKDHVDFLMVDKGFNDVRAALRGQRPITMLYEKDETIIQISRELQFCSRSLLVPLAHPHSPCGNPNNFENEDRPSHSNCRLLGHRPGFPSATAKVCRGLLLDESHGR